VGNTATSRSNSTVVAQRPQLIVERLDDRQIRIVRHDTPARANPQAADPARRAFRPLIDREVNERKGLTAVCIHADGIRGGFRAGEVRIDPQLRGPRGLVGAYDHQVRLQGVQQFR